MREQMRAYRVLIETNSQLKGATIPTIVHARSQGEAMDQVVLVLGLEWHEVEAITVFASEKERI